MSDRGVLGALGLVVLLSGGGWRIAGSIANTAIGVGNRPLVGGARRLSVFRCKEPVLEAWPGRRSPFASRRHLGCSGYWTRVGPFLRLGLRVNEL